MKMARDTFSYVTSGARRRGEELKWNKFERVLILSLAGAGAGSHKVGDIRVR